MSSRRSDSVARAILAVLGTYLVLIGGTSTGQLDPSTERVSLFLMLALAIGWLLVRWRRRWTWQPTPLDGAFAFWWIAIGVSLLANMDVWRRIAIGMWYIGLYTALWFVLHDLLANRWLRRATLIDGVLLGGLVAIVFGYAQLFSASATWFSPPTIGSAPIFNLPRVVGTFGNANILSSLLLIVILLAAGYLLTVRSRLARMLLLIYGIAASFLLFLAFGRGSWVGTAVGFGVMAALLLVDRGLLSRIRLRQWWHKQYRMRQSFLIAGAGLVVIGGIAGGVLLIRSLSISGRGLDLRTYIYDAAFQMFAQKPATGYGLFTFGRGLMQLSSTPPYQIHNQAHDALLNIAAEMGIPGLLALTVTLGACIQAMRRNWRVTAALSRERLLLIGPIAAVAGLAVNHLTDIPSIVPAIFLFGIVTLLAAVAPVQAKPAAARQNRIHTLALTGLWVLLLVTGFWSTSIYTDYTRAMDYGYTTKDFRGAALRIQPAIDSDPSLSIYHLTQGYFLAKAAEAGDSAAIPASLDAYRRFTALEPTYALGWANLSALYWQVGQQQTAIETMEHALALAPQSWEIASNLGAYKEAVGDFDGARRAYAAALEDNVNAATTPEWQTTPLRREFVRPEAINLIAWRTAIWIGMDSIPSARESWKAASAVEQDDSRGHLIDLVLRIEDGDRTSALTQFAAIQAIEHNAKDSVWLHLANAYLAHADGDDTRSAQELKVVDDLAASARIYRLNDLYAGISHIQYFVVGPSEYLLPQLPLLPSDPVVANLSAHLKRLISGEWF